MEHYSHHLRVHPFQPGVAVIKRFYRHDNVAPKPPAEDVVSRVLDNGHFFLEGSDIPHWADASAEGHKLKFPFIGHPSTDECRGQFYIVIEKAVFK